MNAFRTKVCSVARVCLAALVAGTGCGGSDDEASCAAAGTYVGVAVRSADPGDCPAELTIEDIGWTLEPVTVSGNEACGSSHHELSGSGSDGCTHSGTADLNGSSAGVSGKASFRVNCARIGASNCTANFDIIYTKQ